MRIVISIIVIWLCVYIYIYVHVYSVFPPRRTYIFLHPTEKKKKEKKWLSYTHNNNNIILWNPQRYTVTFRDSLHPCHADSDPIEKSGQLSPRSFSIYLFDHRDRRSTVYNSRVRPATPAKGARLRYPVSFYPPRRYYYSNIDDVGTGRKIRKINSASPPTPFAFRSNFSAEMNDQQWSPRATERVKCGRK